MADPQHQSNRLFQLLTSGRRCYQTEDQLTTTGNTTVELSGHKHALTIICVHHNVPISLPISFFSMDLIYLTVQLAGFQKRQICTAFVMTLYS